MGFITEFLTNYTGQATTAAVISGVAAYCFCRISTTYLLPAEEESIHHRLWPLPFRHSSLGVSSNSSPPNSSSESEDRHRENDHAGTEEVSTRSSTTKPISVNYHFTRKCNAECGFCFHTEKSSYVAPEADMKRGLKLLKDAGMRKINFAGGEPFLYPSKLAMLVRYCKVDLGLESVSIISNGTKVTQKWLQENGQFVDVMGVSCDSFNRTTNSEIGRGTGQNVEQLFHVRGWCRELGIKFKLNTVVCRFNWQEDMAEQIERLEPFRWKCFQVLVVKGENDDKDVAQALEDGIANDSLKRLSKRKRNAQRFVVSDDEFGEFCSRHQHLACFVPESNELMATSYLILDEYLCFLDKGDGQEKQSLCILDVGVEAALRQVRWDEQAFKTRGGLYDWGKDAQIVHCGTENAREMEW